MKKDKEAKAKTTYQKPSEKVEKVEIQTGTESDI